MIKSHLIIVDCSSFVSSSSLLLLLLKLELVVVVEGLNFPTLISKVFLNGIELN